VHPLDEAFERPTDFDLSKYWTETVALFEANAPAVEVTLIASDAGFDRLQRMSRAGGRALRTHTVLDDDHTQVCFAFESFDEAYIDLLSLGADVEVIEPEDLRARIASTAGALSALYG
jgi:predicted DNA-binding transcriptional regulator YafY